MSSKRPVLATNQQGIASLLFSMVMMIVISLIVLSFAQIARNGQREALDNQLSTQAYYAAESGVNDATQALKALIDRPTSEQQNDGCGINASYLGTGFMKPDLGNGVAYTCLKVNPTPKNLFTSASLEASKVLHIESATQVRSLTITWSPTHTDAGHPLSACPASVAPAGGELVRNTDWNCPYGMLRFDLVPTTGYTLSRNELFNKTMGVIAVPSRNGGASSNMINYTGGAARVAASCTNPSSPNAKCTAVINGLAGFPTYDMRLMSKYLNVDKVTVTGDDGTGFAMPFVNSQAVVDVTGKAQDVMRRVQVRLPITGGSGSYADYAIGTRDSICKRFEIGATLFKDDSLCPVTTTP